MCGSFIGSGRFAAKAEHPRSLWVFSKNLICVTAAEVIQSELEHPEWLFEFLWCPFITAATDSLKYLDGPSTFAEVRRLPEQNRVHQIPSDGRKTATFLRYFLRFQELEAQEECKNGQHLKTAKQRRMDVKFIPMLR